MHALVIESGGELAAEWVPRELNQASDDQSKQPDTTSWAIKTSEFTKVTLEMRRRDPLRRQVTIDAFADTANTRCPIFFSRELQRRSSGVNAFAHGARLVETDEIGRKRLVWMNGPWGHMLEIYTLITRYHIDCVLLYPSWDRSWQHLLRSLPTVGEPLRLGNAPDTFTPSARVPKKSTGRSRYDTFAILVVWPKRGDPGLVPA